MKASLTLEFDSPAGLYAAVDRLRGSSIPAASEQSVGEQRAHGGSATASTPQEQVTTPRKPRADAGKPRGPYKLRPVTAAGMMETDSEVQTPAPPPPATALTFDDAKAALGRVKDAKGLGTPACIQHLYEFGVNRISELPKEKYADFIRAADAKIVEHTGKK